LSKLNDNLRRDLSTAVAVITPGVAALGEEAVHPKLSQTIRVYDDFCHANDSPRGNMTLARSTRTAQDSFSRSIITTTTCPLHSPDPADLRSPNEYHHHWRADEY